MSYSQNDEERVILEYWNTPGRQRVILENWHTPGRLLDIGAYDGRTFSNTLALLESGWQGVLVEGSPSVFVHLVTNTKHVNVELVNACIVPFASDLVTLYDNNGAVATINERNHEIWKAKTEFNPITVMTCNSSRLLKRFGTNFDMVNIDVEGGSVDLLEDLVPHMRDVKMWVIEHDGMMDRCKDIMVGYKLIYHNGENAIYVR